MARIRDYAITVESAATASMVMNMPTHATGDLLVAFVNKDAASNFTTPGGWTVGQTQISAGAGGGVYYKRAVSSSETVTFTLTSETCCGVVIAVQNVNGSTEADAVSGSAKSAADDSTLPLTGVGITPGHNRCLILHGLSTDSGIGPNALPPWVNLFSGDTGANSLCVSYTQQKTAAAITAPNHWTRAADDSRGFIIAIRDDGSGDYYDGYIPLSTTPARQIICLNGVTGVVDKGTWAGVSANTITSVNGKTVIGTAIVTTSDSAYNPYRSSARSVGASSKTNYSSIELDLTATDDITNLNGLIFFTYKSLASSDYKDQGTPAQGGKYCLFGSDTTNYRAWLIGGFTSKTESPDARNNVLIEFDSTDTDLVTLGTPNFAALNLMQFGSMGYTTACTTLFNELYLLNVAELAGGGGVGLLNLDDLELVVNNGCGLIPLIQRFGVQATIWIPIKFGGTDPIFFYEDKKTFAFPQKADGVKYLDFHVSNDKLGIEFDGQDRGGGDIDKLYFTKCLFISPSSYYWRFASTHDAGADIDFTGSTVVNANVTLRSTVALDSMNFVDCSTFTQNSATITSTEFTNTKVTSGSPADAVKLSDCMFTKTTGTQHAIEIGGTAADMTLSGITFTGYASSDGSTGNEAIYVNIASGSMTITIAGGSTPSIRTAGATVSIINPQVTIELTIFDASTSNTIQGARVILTVRDNINKFYNASVSITGTGTTATVTHTSHGLITGDQVLIEGVTNDDVYNGAFIVTYASASTYTYTTSATITAGTATGTILATFVVMNGLTDANGYISVLSSWEANQIIQGHVRKYEDPLFYQQGVITGTIDSLNGFSTNVQLVRDT